MSSVTFPIGVGGDGSTVTDDSNTSTGLANGGHRTRFVPALTQVVNIANYVVTMANNTTASAAAADADAITASTQATNAATSFTNMDKKYLGSKASDPTLDNQGATLAVGALYWNTTSSKLRVRTSGSVFVDAAITSAGTLQSANNLSELTATAATARTNLGLGSLAIKSSLVAGDIPSLDWSKITTGKPTTLAGYGITDAVGSSHISDATLHLTSAQNTLLDGVTATATELNYASGVTPGSITANKNVIRDANGYITANYLNMIADQISITSSFTRIAIETNLDGYLRWVSATDFHTNTNRKRFTREVVGGTLAVGKNYSIYTGTVAITMSMPTIANSASGDIIQITNLAGTWATNSFTITCPANVNIHNMAFGESLVCDTNAVSGFTLVCNYNDGTYAYWSII